MEAGKKARNQVKCQMSTPPSIQTPEEAPSSSPKANPSSPSTSPKGIADPHLKVGGEVSLGLY